MKSLKKNENLTINESDVNHKIDEISAQIQDLKFLLSQVINKQNWPEYLSIEKSCEYLGITKPTLAQWRNQKIIRFTTIGGVKRAKRSTLDQVMEKFSI